jgi:hypothetical protein
MNRGVRIGMVLALALGGCASQGGAAPGAGAICTIDATQVCEGLKDKPITMNGQQTDAQGLEGSSPITMNISVPLPLPDGDVGAEVQCELNSRTRKVIYSRVTKPPQSEQAATYFKQAGLCTK